MTLCGFARRGRLNVYAPEELPRQADTTARARAAMSSED
jgi:hypothetical protein